MKSLCVRITGERAAQKAIELIAGQGFFRRLLKRPSNVPLDPDAYEVKLLYKPYYFMKTTSITHYALRKDKTDADEVALFIDGTTNVLRSYAYDSIGGFEEVDIPEDARIAHITTPENIQRKVRGYKMLRKKKGVTFGDELDDFQLVYKPVWVVKAKESNRFVLVDGVNGETVIGGIG